jgi:hypothetical protein
MSPRNAVRHLLSALALVVAARAPAQELQRAPKGQPSAKRLETGASSRPTDQPGSATEPQANPDSFPTRVGQVPAASFVQVVSSAPPTGEEKERVRRGGPSEPRFSLTRLKPGTSIPISSGRPRPGATTIKFNENPTQIDASFVFLRQRALTDSETKNFTSHVSSPSIAAWGDNLLVTANWFAALSSDQGSSFRYINPFTTFPNDAAGRGFCCDQVVLYDPGHDLVMWYLQYENDDTGNTGRLAVATGDDRKRQRWHYFNFTPTQLGAQFSEKWFDYPDLTLSKNYLYLTTNVFGTKPADTWMGSVAIRLPLSELGQSNSFTYRYFYTNDVLSLRPTQGATDTMYFGSLQSEASIRVYAWPESETNVNGKGIPVSRFSDGERISLDPNKVNWLEKINPGGQFQGRITAAWVADDRIGFAWTAAQDVQYPNPHVRAALLDRATMRLLAEPVLWNDRYAFGYPAIAPNRKGQLGVSVAVGGEDLYPSQAVGRLFPAINETGGYWELIATARGLNSPASPRWGDYFTVRPHPTLGDAWVATGVTLGARSQEDANVRFYIFQVVENNQGGP